MFRGCERGIIPMIRAKGFSSFPSCIFFGMQLGAVSLTFRELPKIFSQGFGHTYEVSAWNSHHKYYLCSTQMSRYFLGSSWNVSETIPVKQPPDAFPVLVRKEGVAVDCADLQCFLVDNLCNVGIRVADRLFEWFGRRCYLKRILFRLYGLCVGRCSLCQLVRNSDVKKKWRMF